MPVRVAMSIQRINWKKLPALIKNGVRSGRSSGEALVCMILPLFRSVAFIISCLSRGGKKNKSKMGKSIKREGAVDSALKGESSEVEGINPSNNKM